ncbi:hypothetical protein CPU12_06870 [Malaciobacter molluscorum LMG 25693]|uniref:histidine kinase n=1 Tax=Malaciobacter molluscorum LMG 25693 TaxID=870501 RepID=A0A2G1DI89_9BACT|nr:PAS domain S-box protein [Malaciobacter molluscorum]AXX92369.1 PAS sensor-containing two-component system histidine kinase [Malaciobacter molluscorum LMG 25693]PHO18181.1 hypothetical protein CPU12_06870 [Malaciobacter molluscorum LMG 25693]RXJ93970.1 hypothetical protein CRV00_08815 [Malaciobacter molluscorum]
MSEELDIIKLKRNNDELKEIINNSWDGIGIIDLTGKFIYFNNAFIPILGYTKEELTNKSFISLIKNDYKKPFVELMKKNLTNRYDSDINIVCIRKDKQKVYLKITLSTMLNKKFFVINTKDITKEISDDEILDNYVASMHVNTAGIITEISSAFSLLSGYEQDELINKSHSIIKASQKDEDIFDEILVYTLESKEWKGKIKAKRKNGTFFWIDIKTKPTFNKYGDITGYTSLIFDITNEINLNVETKNLQKEVIQKDNILLQQSKLAVMTETLQMLSHEWRQPLNIISIRAQKLELDLSLGEEQNTEDTIEILRQIKDDAQKLSNTIEEFQSFVKIKSEKDDIIAKDIILKAIDIITKDEETKDINFIKEIMDIPTFKSYENEITTILVNILINAKEAIIKNNIKNPVIKLKCYYSNNTVFFEISDNAGGIKEDIINKIFEPYFSTKPFQHGVGLGLYTCKIIIEMHLMGTITVSNHNSGATFNIALPI